LTSTEIGLAELWKKTLQIDLVGLDDDFFEIGGDSLAATILASEIHRRFGLEFVPADIMSYSTVAAQAIYCDKTGSGDGDILLPGFVIGVNVDGKREPLFLLHGATGYMLFRKEFFTILGPDQPVYVFQAPGIDGRDVTPKTVKEFADTYVEVIKKISPSGPWRIAASCAGSLIALELCCTIEKENGEVDRLILIDPPIFPRCAEPLYPEVGARKSIASVKKLLKKIESFLFRQKSLDNDDESSFYRSLRNRARQHKRRLKHINQRVVGEGIIPKEVELSYQPEDMLRTTSALRHALHTYKPRPWEGEAVIIVATQRRSKQPLEHPFWNDHLGRAVYEKINCGHNDLFESRLQDVAHIVSGILK
jgi:thioesterase domain-containing protein/acyl carrier protein